MRLNEQEMEESLQFYNYDSDNEDQLLNSDKTVQSEPQNYMKHLYAKMGYSLESEEPDIEISDKDSLHTETSQSVYTSENDQS